MSLDKLKELSLPKELQPSFVEETVEPAKNGRDLIAQMTTSPSSSSSSTGGKRPLSVDVGMGGSANISGQVAKKQKGTGAVDVGSSSSSSSSTAATEATSAATAAEYPRNLRVPSNPTLKTLLGVLKKEVLELIYTCNTIKVWVQLNIPRIEDGNNFGVGVQEEIVGELSRAEDSGLNVLESMTKYFLMRARIVSKILKWPQVEDYAQSVRELDEKQFISLKLSGLDLRNNYHILFDTITKNMNKLSKPREDSSMSSLMY